MALNIAAVTMTGKKTRIIDDASFEGLEMPGNVLVDHLKHLVAWEDLSSRSLKNTASGIDLCLSYACIHLGPFATV